MSNFILTALIHRGPTSGEVMREFEAKFSASVESAAKAFAEVAMQIATLCKRLEEEGRNG